MKEIKLTNSDLVVLVDDEYYEFLNQRNWSLHTSGYAQSGKIYMHRMLNNTPRGMVTDHINRNKLDNRIENLRTCTRSQNQQNRVLDLGKVKFRGVTFDKRKNKYQARIKINGYHQHIGLFKTAEEAAQAYNDYAYIYHGEFAVLNK
jgi:HNH endonuclease/AP2 domain